VNQAEEHRQDLVQDETFYTKSIRKIQDTGRKMSDVRAPKVSIGSLRGWVCSVESCAGTKPHKVP
jgi:hypothetical protein